MRARGRWQPLIFSACCTVSCNSVLGMDDVSRASSTAMNDSAGNDGVGDGSAGASSSGGGREPSSVGPDQDDRAGAGGGAGGKLPTSEDAGSAGAVPDQDPSCDDAGSSKYDHPYDFYDLGLIERCPETGGVFIDASYPDFYRFELTANSVFTFTLAPRKDSLEGRLYRDATQIDAKNYILSKTGSNLAPASETVNLEKGVYFWSVWATTNVLYDLSLGAVPYEPSTPEPDPEPKNSPSEAYDLGAIGEPVTTTGYVGPTDAEDFYRFNVPVSATLQFSLNEVRGEAMYRIYPDQDQIDLSTPLFASTWAKSNDTAFIEKALARGSYLLRVSPDTSQVGSLYSLKVNVKQ